MISAIWDQCVNSLQQELSAQQFNTWIRPLVPVTDGSSSEFCIVAPNRFVLDWVNDKFIQRINELVMHFFSRAALVPPLSVTLIVANRQVPAFQQPTAMLRNDYRSQRSMETFGAEAHIAAPMSPAVYPPQSRPSAVEKGFAQVDRSHNRQQTLAEADVEGGLTHRTGLNKAFTFESFVEGKSNQMGLAAAQQVVENPGGSYNPLFIYGGVGLGKTHLMHAVGNAMMARNPNAKIVYLHSERFVADMVKALQLNAINDFKR